MSNIEAFKAFRLAFIKEVKVQDAYKNKEDGIKAFGVFERFIENDANAKMTEDRYVQMGTSYSIDMEQGWGPRSTPVKDIYDWLILKKYGLKWKTEGQRIGIARAIVRKHEREGSFKFRNPDRRTNVIATAVNKATPTLLKALGVSALTKVRSDINLEINAINGNTI